MEFLEANQIEFKQREEIVNSHRKIINQSASMGIIIPKEGIYLNENHRFSLHDSLSNRKNFVIYKPYNNFLTMSEKIEIKQDKTLNEYSFSLMNVELSNNNIYNNIKTSLTSYESNFMELNNKNDSNKSLSILFSCNTLNEELISRKLNQSSFSFSLECFTIGTPMKDPKQIIIYEDNGEQTSKIFNVLSNSQSIFKNEFSSDMRRVESNNKNNEHFKCDLYKINNQVTFTLDRVPPKQNYNCLPPNAKSRGNTGLLIPNSKFKPGNSHINQNCFANSSKISLDNVTLKETLNIKKLYNNFPSQKNIIKTAINMHPEEYHNGRISINKAECEEVKTKEDKCNLNLVKSKELLQSKGNLKEIEENNNKHEKCKYQRMIKVKPMKKDSNSSCSCMVF